MNRTISLEYPFIYIYLIFDHIYKFINLYKKTFCKLILSFYFENLKRLKGTQYPEVCYVIGGHYDSISQDPNESAPGKNLINF